jgi:hypothetical protein
VTTEQNLVLLRSFVSLYILGCIMTFFHFLTNKLRSARTFRKELLLYGGGLLAPAQPPSWRTTHCLLFATAYSIRSQLPSISGGRLLNSQHQDAAYRRYTRYKARNQIEK